MHRNPGKILTTARNLASTPANRRALGSAAAQRAPEAFPSQPNPWAAVDHSVDFDASFGDFSGTSDLVDKITDSPLLQGTRVRKSPFVGSLLRHGCTGFTVYNKFVLPISWSTHTPMEEYYNLINNVNLWDVSCQRQVEIRGPDAPKLAQLLSSRNLDKFKPGQAKYVIVTDEQGKVINDPLVMKLAEDRYWFSIADRDLELWARAWGRGLNVRVQELEVPAMAVQGPKSTALMSEIFGADVIEPIKFFEFTKVKWHGLDALIVRAGWSPERGYEIYPIGNGERHGVPRERGEAMFEEIMAAGRKYNIGLGGPHQARRLEGGMMSSCDYLASGLNALELGLPPMLVNLDMEHDFVGKAALRELRGPKGLTKAQRKAAKTPAELNPGADRLLVGLEFEGGAVGEALTVPWPMGRVEGNTHDQAGVQKANVVEMVGVVTSAGFSPRVGSHIGLAAVKAEHATVGTTMAVRLPSAELRMARVAALPFPGTDSPFHKNNDKIVF